MYNQYVAIITEAQAIELAGKEFAPDCYFNPVPYNGEWIISKEEIDQCINEQFIWVKNLPLIPYEPVP